jgi:hypothetical protein
MVGVAQLVERRVVVADVAGSSPVTHPNVIHTFRNSVVTVQVVFSPSITMNTPSTSVSVDVSTSAPTSRVGGGLRLEFAAHERRYSHDYEGKGHGTEGRFQSRESDVRY